MCPNFKEKRGLEQLISTVRDDRKGKNKVVIVIASYKGNDILREHLKYLKNQTFKKFDVAIIYGTDDKFLPTPEWASIVHIRRKHDFGSAWAYYTGEKFFLEEYYDMFIEADNYSFPKSRDLVGKLVEAVQSGNEYAYPKVKYENTSIVTVSGAIRHYACVSRKLAERAGLVYAPFYMYAEDAEYSRRLMNTAKRHTVVDSILDRSYRTKGEFLVTNAYTYYKTKNGIILLRHVDRGLKKIPSLFLTFFSMFYVALFHFLSGNKEAFLEINKGLLAGALLSMKTRKAFNTQLASRTVEKGDFELMLVDYDIKDFYLESVKKLKSYSPRFMAVFYKRDNAATRDLKYFFLPALKIFGKRAAFFTYFGNFPLYTLAPFFCKKLYVYGDGELTTIKENDSVFYRIIFIALSPAIATASLLLFLITIFNPRKLKTYGYGVK